MSDIITVTGLVATTPHTIKTAEGLIVTNFRLASNQRRFDRSTQQWVDGITNWFTVATFRQLAVNASVSIEKGERVIVSGRLKIRDWNVDDKKGTNVEIEADALGHDLSWGTASFSRTTSGSAASASASLPPGEFPSAAELSDGSGGPGGDSAGAVAHADGATDVTDPSGAVPALYAVASTADTTSDSGDVTPF